MSEPGPTPTPAAGEADARIARLGRIVEAIAEHPDPEVRDAAAELLEGLRWLHAEGLARLVDLLARDAALFREALDDPHVSNLLLLHDLVVVDERDRAAAALESVRPFLRGHGGEVQLVAVDEGVVRVRLLGACHGCPSSTATLRQGIERALAEGLPGFRALEVEEGPSGPASGPDPGALDGPDRRAERSAHGDPVSFVPVETLTALEEKARGSGPEGAGDGDGDGGEAVIGPLDDVPEGLHGFLADAVPILLVRIGGRTRAYRNACPGSLLPLHLGAVEDGAVVCPWHGCRFGLETGERIGAGPPLEPLEVEVAGGEARVRW